MFGKYFFTIHTQNNITAFLIENTVERFNKNIKNKFIKYNTIKKIPKKSFLQNVLPKRIFKTNGHRTAVRKFVEYWIETTK